MHNAARADDLVPLVKLVETYCLECHDAESEKGDLNLEVVLDQDIVAHAETWESVVRQLASRQMPPVGEDRPALGEYDRAYEALVARLDAAGRNEPNPGRTPVLRRLTRAEYQNAVRDLLAVEVDARKLLPRDEESHGFDNVTVSELSPVLLDRYLSAAQKVARLAVGAPLREPDVQIYRVRQDITQEERVEGLPFGTRGGTLIRHTFPRDGVYEVRVLLSRDRNEEVEGLNGRTSSRFCSMDP